MDKNMGCFLLRNLERSCQNLTKTMNKQIFVLTAELVGQANVNS